MSSSLFSDVTQSRLIVIYISGQPTGPIVNGQQSKKKNLIYRHMVCLIGWWDGAVCKTSTHTTARTQTQPYCCDGVGKWVMVVAIARIECRSYWCVCVCACVCASTPIRNTSLLQHKRTRTQSDETQDVSVPGDGGSNVVHCFNVLR